MRIPRHTAIILTVLFFALSGFGLWLAHEKMNTGAAANGTNAAFRMSDRISTLHVEQSASGPVFQFQSGPEGSPPRTLTAEEFAAEVARLQHQKQNSGWLMRVLDITSFGGVLWVLLGFAGQFMFTGRMLVQWIASERAKRSVVPTAFWWMSLIGSSMLILYFWWRVDVVGILGQTTGWVVYIRNLWLLKKPAEEVAEK